MKDTLFYSEFTLNCKGILHCFNRPVVMGIINITPDSFHIESRLNTENELVERVNQMILEGVDWLDVGGYSSRPGADFVSEQTELDRVIPAIKLIHSKFPQILISIDTFRSKVAEEAIIAGASIINDITGTTGDSSMLEVAKKHSTPLIVMHMRGSIQNMMSHCNYENVMHELISYFQNIITKANKLGVNDLIIDPGFGFSKELETNFEVLNKLAMLKVLNCPILAGVSRKSMIYKSLKTTAENALNGTTVLNTVALLNGASILRVHDVKEAKEAVDLIMKLKSS